MKGHYVVDVIILHTSTKIWMIFTNLFFINELQRFCNQTYLEYYLHCLKQALCLPLRGNFQQYEIPNMLNCFRVSASLIVQLFKDEVCIKLKHLI